MRRSLMVLWSPKSGHLAFARIRSDPVMGVRDPRYLRIVLQGESVMWNEFKSFAFKGNAFDLAIGVIIGAAFSRIVDGIVNLLIMTDFPL